MDRHLPAALLAAACLLPACTDSLDSDAIDASFSQALTSSEELGVLAFANDCATTVEVLDDDAALDVRAARGIVQSRNGSDGACGTVDDAPFASMEVLDAVPYVGNVALTRLLEHAVLLGYVTSADESIAGTFEGIEFTMAEAEGVLAIANGASHGILDVDVALDARAASGILAARPFDAESAAANLQTLAAAPYVGQTALGRLKSYVDTWQACETEAAIIKGVEFSSLAAHDALDMLNYAPRDLLTGISGIGDTIAERIEFERPFESLDQLANVSGVGPSVAGNILEETETHWCPISGARCGCPGDEASYRPPLVTFDENGLYFLLAYRQWDARRLVDSGFIDHDGTNVVLTDVQVSDDPDEWQEIAEQVFDELWDCCLQHQYFGQPLEIGPNRKGVLHLGEVINAADDKTYVMAYWQDVDDASFAWLYEKDATGAWLEVGTQFLN